MGCRMQWLKLWALMMCGLLACAQLASAQGNTKALDKQVLVSIHPVALLIKSAWPQLQVDTLMQANQSPHDFALRPSHRQIIASAHHVIWLGKDMEPYLDKVIHNHDGALDLSGLFEEGEKEHAHHEHEHHAGHDHAGGDPHIWLNPESVPLILAKVQAALGLPAPQGFLSQFSIWQKQAGKQLSKNEAGFVSFHDAFHYWIDYFELNQLEVLALNPEQPIGTRHLVQVRQLLQQGNVSCLFVEPQFKASIVDKLQQGTEVPVVNIDPLASQFSVNSGQFLDFYEYLQQQFITCLNHK